MQSPKSSPAATEGTQLLEHAALRLRGNPEPNEGFCLGVGAAKVKKQIVNPKLSLTIRIQFICAFEKSASF